MSRAAFVSLVKILGISLSDDELPRSALIALEGDNERKNSKSSRENAEPTQRSLQSSSNRKIFEREKRNLTLIEQIFDQLSNFSGQFLKLICTDDLLCGSKQQ